MDEIHAFTKLLVWQRSHRLVIEVYRTTDRFPHKETFGLTSQLRRATVSISSNISEGYSRPSYRDKFHFYSMSLGSLTEVQNQLLIARDIGYLDLESYLPLAELSIEVSKLLNALIKKTKSFIH